MLATMHAALRASIRATLNVMNVVRAVQMAMAAAARMCCSTPPVITDRWAGRSWAFDVVRMAASGGTRRVIASLPARFAVSFSYGAFLPGEKNLNVFDHAVLPSGFVVSSNRDGDKAVAAICDGWARHQKVLHASFERDVAKKDISQFLNARLRSICTTGVPLDVLLAVLVGRGVVAVDGEKHRIILSVILSDLTEKAFEHGDVVKW
jgi:hypothetical protein